MFTNTYFVVVLTFEVCNNYINYLVRKNVKTTKIQFIWKVT